MATYRTVPLGENSPDVVNCVKEIRLGEVNRYEYDRTLHLFRLDWDHHRPLHHPDDSATLRAEVAAR